MSIIYKTTNLVNRKIYIGQHNTSADDGYLGTGKLIKQAIKKYKRNNFQREILEYCTSANVNEREIYWIAKLNATNSNIGYNLSKGGKGIKIDINGKNNPMFGRKQSKQTRLKMSQNHIDFTGKKNPNYGKGKYLYIITNLKTGEVFKIKSMLEFCQKNNLNYSTVLWCLSVGQKIHKNFKLERKLLK